MTLRRGAVHPVLQLFTVRKAVRRGLEKALRQAAAMGYGGVESWKLKPNRENAALLAALGEDGLCHQSAQISCASLETDFAAQVKFLHATGCRIAVAAMLPLDTLGSEDGLKRFCASLNGLGIRYRREGIILAFHHHHYEFLLFGKRRGMDILLEELDGDMGFICDTYWAQLGGIAPERLIRRMGSRLTGIHLRDYTLTRPWFRPVDCPVGCGTLDIPGILAAAQEAGAYYAAIEQNSPDPWNDAAQSLAYITRETGKRSTHDN